MSGALYTLEILRLAASLSGWPRLETPDGSSDKRSAICGSRVTIDLAFDDEGHVATIGVEARACALGQASAALVAAHATGRSHHELAAARDTLTDYLAGRSEAIGDWPGIECLKSARDYPARHPSIRLPFEAAAEAAESARAKTRS